MHFTDRQEGRVAVVAVGGRLDAAGAPLLEKHLNHLATAARPRVVVDCGELEYVSSAGLRVFLAASKQIREADGAFALANMAKIVREIFDIAGFSAIIAIHGTVAESVQACG